MLLVLLLALQLLVPAQPALAEIQVKVEDSADSVRQQQKVRADAHTECLGCKLLFEELWSTLSVAANQASQDNSGNVDVLSVVSGLCEAGSYKSLFNGRMAQVCQQLLSQNFDDILPPLVEVLQTDPQLKTESFLKLKDRVCTQAARCEVLDFQTPWSRYALLEQVHRQRAETAAAEEEKPAKKKKKKSKKSANKYHGMFQDRALNRCTSCVSVVQDVVNEAYASRGLGQDIMEDLLEGVCALTPLRHPEPQVLQDLCELLVEDHGIRMGREILRILGQAHQERKQPEVSPAEQICAKLTGWCQSEALERTLGPRKPKLEQQQQTEDGQAAAAATAEGGKKRKKSKSAGKTSTDKQKKTKVSKQKQGKKKPRQASGEAQAAGDRAEL